MTPEQLAKTTEHSHQAAFFCWCQQNQHRWHVLRFMHAIPNGGERHIAVASRLKAEGVKIGVPDVFLPHPRIRDGMVIHHGLYIEFKRPKTEGKAAGRLSPDQERWAEYLISQRFAYFTAFDYRQAVEATVNYLAD